MKMLRSLIALLAGLAVGVPAFAANLTYNSVTTYTDTSFTASVATVNKPASCTASGMLEVTEVLVVVGSGSRTIDTPTGGATWLAAGAQQTTSLNGGGAIGYHRTYYKVTGGSEPSSYGFSWDGAAAALINIVCYTNPDPTTPYQLSSQVWTAPATGTAITIPSITTTNANELLVAFTYSDGGGAGTTFTSSALTERSDSGVAVFDTLQVSAGASGTKLVTAAAGGYYYGTMLAFNSAPGGGSPAVLSSPTPSGTLGTSTTASTGATTDQSTGTLSCVLSTSNNVSGATATQVIAGQNSSGSSATFATSASVSTTSPACSFTGLTASTLYYYAEAQNNGNGNSNVVSGSFTTGATAPAATGSRGPLMGVGM